MQASKSRSQILLYHPDSNRWRASLSQVALDAVTPDEVDDPSSITFAVVWKPPHGLLKRYSNLKAIQAAGAGVDSILSDPDLPRQVPVARIVDPLMSERMATWVLWGVINSQRKMDAYLRAQLDRRWDLEIEPAGASIDNCDWTVGVMGCGEMGGTVIKKLVCLGYKVRAWARRQREVEGVYAFYSGMGALKDFVEGSNVLVCLLPLTDQTKGIIHKELLGWLPKGATFINGARGAHVVESDLLWALDSGPLESAILDVFNEEPLPRDSPLWVHPRIRMTPHVSAMTTLQTSLQQISENYSRSQRGEAMLNLVDVENGY